MKSQAAASDLDVPVASLYPSFTSILVHGVVHVVRISLLCALACYLLQPLFVALVKSLGIDEVHLFVAAATFAHTTVAAGLQVFFTLCNRYHWFQQHRIRRPPSLRNPPGLIQSALLRVGFYHAIGPPFMYWMWSQTPFPSVDQPLPPVWEMMMTFGIAVVWDFEIVGFLLHLWQHKSSTFYGLTHKLHHRFLLTVAMSAEYVSFPEMMVAAWANYNAFQGYPMVMYVVYVVWRVSQTYEVHSGYSFRNTWLCKIGLLNGHRAEFHDFHHTNPTNNFGENLFMDYLFRTCDGWVLHLHKQGRKPTY